MNYSLIKQNPKHCVAACLQMILKRRNIKPDSQEHITKELDIKLHRGDLGSYFKAKNYPLYCVDLHLSHSNYRDYDDIIYSAFDADCDILAGYAYEVLHNTKTPANHLSIIADLRRGTCDMIDDVILVDPACCDYKTIPFFNLVKSIFAADGAFHLISPDPILLDDLMSIDLYGVNYYKRIKPD